MGTRTAVDWERVLQAAAVPSTRVRTVAELAADDQLAAIDLVSPLPHPMVPDLQVVDLPFRVDGTRSSQWLPPPMLGQHTDEILHELGHDNASIARLRDDGTVA